MGTPQQLNKVIFFDGICVLCNRSVDFLIKKDRKGQFKFASLQSDFAISFLSASSQPAQKKDTIIYFESGSIYTKSAAVLKIAGNLAFPYSALSIFHVIPVSWLDIIYDKVAKKRYRWFGKKEKCRVPDEKTRGRIIA